MKKLKVGIIGCGVIGSEIAKSCAGPLKDKLFLVALCDADKEKAVSLNKALGTKLPALDIDGLIKISDIVVEAASAKISAAILEKSVKAKKDILIMSVGGLLGKEGLLKSAEDGGIKVYIPSGAVCGVDGLKAAAVGKISSVTLTTRKPLKGLEGAPYLKEKGIDLSSIKEETVVFDGTALAAVSGFPKNINVSAVLSLAGIGFGKTRVKIVTSPAYTKNVHEVEIAGDAGRITTRTENVPSKANPKTSALAVLSAIAALKNATSNVRIGT